MYKRIIAVAAALGMIYGSALLPAADTGGEPVKLNKTEKTELRNSKTEISTTESTYVSTRERIYGPIEPVPVEVKDDTTRSDEDVERTEPGLQGPVDGDSDGGDGIDYAEPASGDILESDDTVAEYPEPDIEEPVGEFVEDCGEDVTAEEYLEVEPEPEPAAEEPQMEYLGDWTISFYCNCPECCGVWSGGATASGAMPSAWWTAATGELDFGTIVYVDGLGTFEIQDRGTDYGWLDVFVGSHDEALANGLQTRSVYIVR